jgi:hypothetical protein
MSVQLQVSQVIDRPVDTVFRFYALGHVRNHPRWDSDIKLEQISEGPMGIGTLIRRQNTRSGKLVEGSMEVVEFEPNRAFGMIIRDGPVEMRGRATFEVVNDHQTKLTTFVEIPGMDEKMDRSFLQGRLERSGQNIKKLIESETQE